MPYKLDVPIPQSYSTNTVEITSHTINHKTGTLHYSYWMGEVGSQGAVVAGSTDIRSLAGTDVAAIIAAASSYAATVYGGDIYKSEKRALYDDLIVFLGSKYTGTLV